MMNTGYLIDMDGVVYRESQLIPGAKDFITALIRNGTPFIFLTNNSAPTPGDLAVRLGHMGIPGLSTRHFYTSALNTADLLSEVVDRFADFKLIRIHCEGADKCTPERLSAYGELVERSPGIIQLKVKRERVIPVCKALLDDLPVSDIDIQETPIEDIVRRLFARPQ